LIVLEFALSESGDEMGLDIVDELRNNADTEDIPIIFLSAKTTEMDKVKGLNAGADDYIAKPFGTLELVARVTALLRRCGSKNASCSQKPQQAISSIDPRGLRINIDARQVMVDNRHVHLTFKEFELLLYLYNNIGRAISRDKLLDDLWGVDFAGIYRTVDVHVKNLRHKLNDKKENPRFIQTIRGHGYKLLESNLSNGAK